MSDDMQCTCCGQPQLKTVVQPLEVHAGDRSCVIADTRTVCSACGNVSYRGAQISNHELAVARNQRDLAGLMQHTELIAIRSALGITPEEMDSRLGLRQKTWARLERGKVVQPPELDQAIRAIAPAVYVARDWISVLLQHDPTGVCSSVETRK